jgi:hypothetical protein
MSTIRNDRLWFQTFNIEKKGGGMEERGSSSDADEVRRVDGES